MPECLPKRSTLFYRACGRARSSSICRTTPLQRDNRGSYGGEHALGLEFDRSVDAFLRSYVTDPHARGTFHFDAEKFAQLMQQPPLRISKDVRYDRALDMAGEADRRDAPERRRQAKRARVHL